MPMPRGRPHLPSPPCLTAEQRGILDRLAHCPYRCPVCQNALWQIVPDGVGSVGTCVVHSEWECAGCGRAYVLGHDTRTLRYGMRSLSRPPTPQDAIGAHRSEKTERRLAGRVFE